MTTVLETQGTDVLEESSTSPDGLGKLGKAFGAPKDQQWYLRKQHPQRDGGRKNWPGRDYPEVLGPPEELIPHTELTMEVKDSDGATATQPGAILGTDQTDPAKDSWRCRYFSRYV